MGPQPLSLSLCFKALVPVLQPSIPSHLVLLLPSSAGSLHLSQFRAGKNAVTSVRMLSPPSAQRAPFLRLRSQPGLPEAPAPVCTPCWSLRQHPLLSSYTPPLGNVCYLCLFHETEYAMRMNNYFTHLLGPCHIGGQQ